MKNDLKLNGKITKVFPSITGNGKNGEWTKNTFLVKDNAKYPQEAKFELFNKLDTMDFVKVGNEVEVSFNLKTNEWQGKYYTSLQAWSVRINNQSQTQTNVNEPVKDLPEDDLPF